MTAGFDSRKQVDVSYLNFSKAFDKVPHKSLGLLRRNHDIKGSIFSWVGAIMADGRAGETGGTGGPVPTSGNFSGFRWDLPWVS